MRPHHPLTPSPRHLLTLLFVACQALAPSAAIAGDGLLQWNPAEVQVGPFGRAGADGKWQPDTGLAETMSVMLSSNGGAMVARVSTKKIVHDRGGFYIVPLAYDELIDVGTLDIVVFWEGEPVRKMCSVMSLVSWDAQFQQLALVDHAAATADIVDVGGTAITTNIAGVIKVDVVAINGNTFTGAELPVDVLKWNGGTVTDVAGADGHRYPSVNIEGLGGNLTASDNQEDAYSDGGYGFTGWAIPTVTTTGSVSGNVTGSVGSISGITFPTNFDDLAITVTTGKVTVGTNDDKTGYTISGTTTTLDALEAHGNGYWITATGFSTHNAAAVWSVGARALTDKAGFSLAADQSGVTIGTVTDVTNGVTVGIGGITIFSIASDAISGAALAPTAGTEIAIAVDTKLDTEHGAGSWEDAGGLTAATVADAVWEEAIADHSTGTTFGGKNQIGVPSATLNDYKATGFSTHSAANVWTAGSRSLSTPGDYMADVSNLDATISSRATISGVWAYTGGPGRSLTTSVDANLTKIDGHLLVGTGTQIADRFEAFFNQGASTFSVNTALSSFKATGFSTHAAADVWTAGSRSLSTPADYKATGFSTHSAANVWSVATRALTDKAGFSISGTITTLDALDTALDTAHGSGSWEDAGGLTAAAVADAVWEEAIADHSTGTTFGGKNQIGVPSATLNDYKATGFSTHDAAAVWTAGSRSLSTPSDYMADVSNLDAAVSSRATISGVWAYTGGPGRSLTSSVDANLTKIDGHLLVGTGTQIADRFEAFFNQAGSTFSVDTALSSFKATGFSTHAAADVWTAGSRSLSTPADYKATGFSTHSAANVWSVATRELSGTIGDFDALDTALDTAHGAGSWATATGFSTHTAADVWTAGSRSLSTPNDYKATGFSTHSAANVWSVGTRSLTDKAGFSITGTITTLDGLNNFDPAVDLVLTSDVYHAAIDFLRDPDASLDRYGIIFYVNAQPVTSGITNAKIQVIKAADGSDLIALTALTQVGATGAFKLNEASDRLPVGDAAIVHVEATIDGQTRTWRDVIGRDSY